MSGFTIDDPSRIQMDLDPAVGSGSGTGTHDTCSTIRPPDGRKVVLSTDDGVNAPAAGTPLVLFGTWQAVPTMQATTFRNPATGEIILADRGTADDGELSCSSVPPGAGLPETADRIDEGDLRPAHDFSAEGLTTCAGGDESLLSFTGGSLGGIVAGAMGAITHREALRVAISPQSPELDIPVPFLDLRLEDVSLAPDPRGIVAAGPGAGMISTGDQDDVTIAGGGGQAIDGGNRSDRPVYAWSDLGMTVSLGTSTGTGTGVSGFADGNTITETENLPGSRFDGTLTDDGGANILFGDAGRDTVHGWRQRRCLRLPRRVGNRHRRCGQPVGRGPSRDRQQSGGRLLHPDRALRRHGRRNGFRYRPRQCPGRRRALLERVHEQ